MGDEVPSLIADLRAALGAAEAEVTRLTGQINHYEEENRALTKCAEWASMVVGEMESGTIEKAQAAAQRWIAENDGRTMMEAGRAYGAKLAAAERQCRDAISFLAHAGQDACDKDHLALVRILRGDPRGTQAEHRGRPAGPEKK